MRSVVTQLVGKEGCGKTHLGLTFPSPLVIFDYDGRAEDAVGNVRKLYPDKEIERIECALPPQDSPSTKFRNITFGKEDWEWFLDRYDESLAKYTTIQLDTWTVVAQICRAGYMNEIDKELGRAEMYTVPNARLKGIIDKAKAARKNLVLTSHVKPVYIDGNRTEEMEADGLRQTGAYADFVLGLDLVKSEGKVYTEATILKSGLSRALYLEVFQDIDYEYLAALVD